MKKKPEKKPKKHTHVWKFDGWLPGWTPWNQSSLDHTWSYRVNDKCECGEKRVRSSSYEEVKSYIDSKTCSLCQKFGVNHETKDECFQHLLERVSEFEEKFEKLSRVL